MAELSIRIRIADREYPMRVDESEEERLRTAGRLLNDRIKLFREQFRLEDKQDLLAMVAFESMAEKLKVETEQAEAETSLSSKLTVLQELAQSLKLD